MRQEPRLALALVALLTAVVTAQQPAPFVARSTVVVVPAVVLDKKGVSVPGLIQEDFELFEDGKPVPISQFVPSDDPAAAGSESGRYIAIVLDDIRTPPERAWKVKDIAKQFVNRMGPKDIVGVIKLNGGRATTSNSKADVLASIERFAPHAMNGEGYSDRVNEQSLETISDLAIQLNAARHRRKVLVIIGSATLFSPTIPDWATMERPTRPVPEYSSPWAHAIRETSRNNVAVYVMDPQGQVVAGQGRFDGARSFADETGGEALVNTNDVNRAVSRIWQDAGSYYLLGYVPAADDNKMHQIEVKVKRAGVQVRARRSRG